MVQLMTVMFSQSYYKGRHLYPRALYTHGVDSLRHTLPMA